MKLQRSTRYNPAWFVILPTINVLFVVLGYFALSKSFILQPGIAIRLPQSSFALRPERDPLLLSVTLDPVLTLFLDDRRITRAELAELLAKQTDKTRPLIIKADRRAPYELVMDLANLGLKHGLEVALATADPRS